MMEVIMSIRTIAGAVFLFLGMYLFFNGGGSLSTGDIFAYFWPSMFVIPLGLFFHWLHFHLLQRKAAGLLIPGGILFTAGIVCQIAMLFDAWVYLWPGFLMAVAVGLFEFYWVGGRNKWLLIPINILVVLSLVFFAVFSTGALLNKLAGEPLIAVVLLLAGAAMLMMKKKEF
jgi:hypothetical protein